MKFFPQKQHLLSITFLIKMESKSLNSSLPMAMTNELDFLVYLGLSTGSIFEYIRISQRMEVEKLAKLLNLTTDDLSKLEKSRSEFPTEWHLNLRAFFEK